MLYKGISDAVNGKFRSVKSNLVRSKIALALNNLFLAKEYNNSHTGEKLEFILIGVIQNSKNNDIESLEFISMSSMPEEITLSTLALMGVKAESLIEKNKANLN